MIENKIKAFCEKWAKYLYGRFIEDDDADIISMTEEIKAIFSDLSKEIRVGNAEKFLYEYEQWRPFKNPIPSDFLQTPEALSLINEPVKPREDEARELILKFFESGFKPGHLKRDLNTFLSKNKEMFSDGWHKNIPGSEEGKPEDKRLVLVTVDYTPSSKPFIELVYWSGEFWETENTKYQDKSIKAWRERPTPYTETKNE